MNRFLRYQFPVSLLLFLLGASWVRAADSHRPRSHEAVLIEIVSSSQIKIEATGIGIGRSKHLQKSADLDARRAALNFLLNGGTDPLLSSEEERQRFEPLAEQFYAPDQVNSFIAWAQADAVRRVKINRGKELKLTRQYLVNGELVRAWLEEHEVLEDLSSLRNQMGLPFIMVLPRVAAGEDPLAVLSGDPDLQQGAGVIESFLTARSYDVVIPEQARAVQETNRAQLLIKDAGEDIAYQLAMIHGSDLYITFSLSMSRRTLGKTEVSKAAVTIKAFETTTARSLGTETGYSEERPGSDAVLIEEAVNDAIHNVLSRLESYWKEDTKRGSQYKVILRLEDGLSLDEIDDVQFTVGSLLDETARQVKENLITDQTMDYIIWVDPEQYGRSSNLYQQLRRQFSTLQPLFRMRRIQVNRKLLLLEIVRI